MDFTEAELEEARRLYRTLARLPRLDLMKPRQVRFVRGLLAVLGRAPSPLGRLGLRARKTEVGAGGHTARVSIVEPQGTPRGIVVDIHGGAWTFVRPVQDEPLIAPLADAGFIVVSVDYRYAPDVPFEAVIGDCVGALTWVLTGGMGRYGVSDVFLHGDSSGAHLGLAAALRARDRGVSLDPLRGLVLFFGCYDLSATLSVRAAGPETLILYGPFIAPFFRRVTGRPGETERRDPAISPLYADLRGLPPTLLVVGGGDFLRDDTLLLAERLRQVGAETELVVVPEAPHAFNRFPLALARRVNAYGLEWMRRRVRGNWVPGPQQARRGSP